MCTLAVWIGVFRKAPLVVAANRDERFGRASSGPMLWPGSPRIVAPRDDVAGGSWWALNEHGIFVGLTNRAGAPGEPSRRSRGLLVMDVAACRTVDEARSRLEAIAPGTYNGFHLLACDHRSGVLAVGTEERVDLRPLGPGMHLLSERSFGAAEITRDTEVNEALSPFARRPLDLQGLGRALGTHGEHPLLSLCVHLDDLSYGTRSSSLLALRSHDPGTLLFADGPPCRTSFEDRSSLLEALGRA